jgi:hypothetical protein
MENNEDTKTELIKSKRNLQNYLSHEIILKQEKRIGFGGNQMYYL